MPGLQITEVDGRLADQLSLHGLRYENAGLIVELDRLTLDWQPWLLWQGLLQINLLELGAISIELPQNSGESSDSEALRLPQPLLPVAVELTELKINQLSIRRAGAQLFAASDSRLSAQLRGSDIELRELRSRVEPVGPVSAQAKARLLASQVIVEELSLSGPGQINATGQLDWLANQLQLHAAWTELQWPPQAQNTAESGLIIRSALGSLTLSGALSGPAIELQAELGERSTVSANGTLDPENLQLQARWTQLQWPLSGTKPQILSPQGELVFSGLPDDWQARLNAEALRDGQQAQLSATATGNTMMATLSSLEIRALSGVIRGDGAVNWGNASTAQASLSLASTRRCSTPSGRSGSGGSSLPPLSPPSPPPPLLQAATVSSVSAVRPRRENRKIVASFMLLGSIVERVIGCRSGNGRRGRRNARSPARSHPGRRSRAGDRRGCRCRRRGRRRG